MISERYETCRFSQNSRLKSQLIDSDLAHSDRILRALYPF